jgi:DNA-binding NarL/FixJ family response regulator
VVRVFIEASTTAGRQRLTTAAVRAGWRLVDRRDAEAVLSEPTTRHEVAASVGSRAALDDLDAKQPHEALTPREHDVLRLLAEGAGNREIAERLGVTAHTVKFHLSAIFGKLGATTRTEAVRRALRWGWVDL